MNHASSLAGISSWIISWSILKTLQLWNCVTLASPSHGQMTTIASRPPAVSSPCGWGLPITCPLSWSRASKWTKNSIETGIWTSLVWSKTSWDSIYEFVNILIYCIFVWLLQYIYLSDSFLHICCNHPKERSEHWLRWCQGWCLECRGSSLCNIDSPVPIWFWGGGKLWSADIQRLAQAGVGYKLLH